MKNEARKIRLALGLTQTQFASLLGVHAITVSKWERGQAQPPPYNCQQLAAISEGLAKKTVFDHAKFYDLVELGQFVQALAFIICCGA